MFRMIITGVKLRSKVLLVQRVYQKYHIEEIDGGA